MFLFIRVFFILDNDMRCDLRDNFIILKNAEQESQYLAIKDGFARKIKSKKLSIRVMLLFYFIVCAIYIHRLGIAIHQ